MADDTRGIGERDLDATDEQLAGEDLAVPEDETHAVKGGVTQGWDITTGGTGQSSTGSTSTPKLSVPTPSPAPSGYDITTDRPG
jgi:hypothetical protein